MFIFKWFTNLGKAFGAKADDVEEAREEIKKSPILTDGQKNFALTHPPDKIEHARPPQDDER